MNTKIKLNPKKILTKIYFSSKTFLLSYGQQYSKVKGQKLSKAVKLAIKLTIFFIVLGLIFYGSEKLSILIFTKLKIIPT